MLTSGFVWDGIVPPCPLASLGREACGEGGRAVWVSAAGLSRTEQEGKQPGRLGGEGQSAFGNWRAVGGKGISKNLPRPASLKDNRSLEHRLLHFCFHGSTSLRIATPHVSTAPGAARPALWESSACAQLAQSTSPPCTHGTARDGSETSPESCQGKQNLKLWRPFPKDHFQRLGKT